MSVKVNKEFFSDIGLSKFLLSIMPPSDVNCILNELSVIKDDNEILDEQITFSFFERDVVIDYIMNVNDALSDLSLQYEYYCSESENFKKSIRQIKILASYIDLINIASSVESSDLPHRGRIFDFYSFACAIKNDILFKNAVDKLNCIRSLRNKNDKLVLDLSTREGSVQDIIIKKGANPSDYISRFNSLVTSLGLHSIKQSFSNDFEITLPDSILDLIPILFTDLYKEITSASYYALSIKMSILDYRPVFRYYILMNKLKRTLQSHSIPLCFPQLTNEKTIYINKAYDISLLSLQNSTIIPNDVVLKENSNILVVCGTNGSGKTTYLRSIGVIALFASVGFYVPCSFCKIFIFSRLYTHFQHDESIHCGRLDEEIARIEELLTDERDCLLLINEIFSTTNESYASELSFDLCRRLSHDRYCTFWVTHNHFFIAKTIDYYDSYGLSFVYFDENHLLHEFDTNTILDYYSSIPRILQKHGLDRDTLEKRDFS